MLGFTNISSRLTIKSGPWHRTTFPAKVKNRNINSDFSIHMLISKPGWDFGHWEHYRILGYPSHWPFLNCKVPINLTIPWREEERYWNGGETLDITLQKPNWGCEVSLVKGPSVILRLRSQFYKTFEGLVTMIAESIRLHIQQQTLCIVWSSSVSVDSGDHRTAQNLAASYLYKIKLKSWYNPLR